MRSEHAVPVSRMERLSRMRDFEVDRNQPDPRGWKVVNREGRSVGEVKDLIVDTERMTATYLDVELDAKLFDLRDTDPHVLIPVERARADGKQLIADDITGDWVTNVCAERQRARDEFWERWWDRGDHRADPDRQTRITRRLEDGDLPGVMAEVRPGEEVRIPVVNEEIIVERRPLARDDRR